MRLHHGVLTLAAAASALTLAGPAAARNDNGPYPFVAHHHVAPQYLAPRAIVYHSATDWPVIGLGVAGGLAALGLGATTSRRRARRDPSVGRIGAASGS